MKPSNSQQTRHGRFTDQTPISYCDTEVVQGLNTALNKFSQQLAQQAVRE